MVTTSPSTSTHRRLFLDSQRFLVYTTLRPAFFCGFNVKLVPKSRLSVAIREQHPRR
jgi:hypothetical protein